MRRSPLLCAGLVLCACSVQKAAPAAPAPVEPPAEAHEIPITSVSDAAVGLYRQGRDIFEAARPFEARPYFEQAVAQDPTFALARGMLGNCLPGEEGLRHLDVALSLASALPESELQLVHLWRSARRGEEDKSRAALDRLGEIAAADWRVELLLGQRAMGENHFDQAARLLRRAVTLNPLAANAYNSLGFALAEIDQLDAAVAAQRRYVALKKNDPNPLDSLGEILLRAGRFDDAEAAFQAALAMNPHFWVAALGMAQSRFLRADWDGGRLVAREAMVNAEQPSMKIGLQQFIAWSYLSERKPVEALAAVDEAERMARADKDPALYARTAALRMAFFAELGRRNDAVRAAAVLAERSKAKGLEGAQANGLRRLGLFWRLRAEAKSGHAAQAEEALRAIEAESLDYPDNPGLASGVHFARAEVAAARGSWQEAVAETALCTRFDWQCRELRVQAQQRSGDKAGAGETRRALLAERRRDRVYQGVDPIYLYTWSQVRDPASPQAAN